MESKVSHRRSRSHKHLLKHALPTNLCSSNTPSSGGVFQEIRNLHNEQLMGIRREEEMEMSDDDMEDAPDSKDSEDSGMRMWAHVVVAQPVCQRDRRMTLITISRGGALRALENGGRQLRSTKMTDITPTPAPRPPPCPQASDMTEKQKEHHDADAGTVK